SGGRPRSVAAVGMRTSRTASASNSFAMWRRPSCGSISSSRTRAGPVIAPGSSRRSLAGTSRSALMVLSPPFRLPAGAIPACVDVNESAVCAGRRIHTDSAHQLGVATLHFLGGLCHHTGIVHVDTPVAVEVVHASVAVVVDEEVHRIAVHVP